MFCNYCGSSNPDDAAFCSACGRRVARVDARPTPDAPPAREDVSPPVPAPATVPAGEAAPARKSGGALLAWTVMLVLIGAIGAGVALELSDSHEDPSQSAPVTSPDTSSTPPPAQSTPAATTSIETTTTVPPSPPESAPVVESAPPVPAPAPASPPSIVGKWKTSLMVGEGTLTLTGDGHCYVKNLLANDSGIYTYSPLDGELRIQVDSLFNHDIIKWHAQLSPDGESLTVLEPEGAAHVYHRVHE